MPRGGLREFLAPDVWAATARALFGAAFGSGALAVDAVGNTRSATAFLYGLAARELRADELARRDPDLELLIRVRATKG